MSTPKPSKVGVGTPTKTTATTGGPLPPPPPVVKRGKAKFDHSYARNLERGGAGASADPKTTVPDPEKVVPGPSGVGSDPASQSLKEALETKYVEDFVDANEAMPNDVARNMSKILEVHCAQENILKDVNVQMEMLLDGTGDPDQQKDMLLQLLLLSEQLGDEGAQAAQAIDALVGDKAHDLDMDHRKLVNGNGSKGKGQPLRRGSSSANVGVKGRDSPGSGSEGTSAVASSSSAGAGAGPSTKKSSKGPFNQQKSLLFYDTLSNLDNLVADPDNEWGGFYRSCKTRHPPVYSGMCLNARLHSGNVKKKKNKKANRRQKPMGTSKNNESDAEEKEAPKPSSSKSISVPQDSSKNLAPTPVSSSTKKTASAPKPSSSKSILVTVESPKKLAPTLVPSSTKKVASAPKPSSSKSILLPPDQFKISAPAPSSTKTAASAPGSSGTVDAKDTAKVDVEGDSRQEGDGCRTPEQKNQSLYSSAQGENSPEPIYCLCEKVSFGKMISCDNDLCPMEWFHFKCVGVKKAPKEDETWYIYI